MNFPEEGRELYPFSSHFLSLPAPSTFPDTYRGLGHKVFRYHYVDEGGGGQGPHSSDDVQENVVLLHGNPTWSFYYRNLILNLREKRRVIAPDHMGCGFSDRPWPYPYQLKTHIENLESLLIGHLKLKKFSLVVHDWGGAIGFGLATKYPDRIEKIVILNTAAFLSPHIPKRIALCKLPILGYGIIRWGNGFAWPATWMAVQKKMPRPVKRMYLYPYKTSKERVAIHQFVRDIPMSSHHPSYETLLEIENQLPLLQDKPLSIMWGQKDFCFHQRFLERWQVIYPKAEVKVYPQAGHYILEDLGREGTQEISQFLTF